MVAVNEEYKNTIINSFMYVHLFDSANENACTGK